jgi:hypothetical protein
VSGSSGRYRFVVLLPSLPHVLRGRTLAAAALTTALLAAGAYPAQATVPTGPRISVGEAGGTLPAAGELPPGNVTGESLTTVTKPTGLAPCNVADPTALALHDNGAAIGVYATGPSTPTKQLAQWVVSTRVFATPAAAHAAVARIGVAERRCPRKAKVHTAAGTTTVQRTWSGRYVTAAGWHGYHTVDVLSVAGQSTKLRHIAVYLQRGNAVIQVEEVATVVGHNSASQESRRLAVQKLVAARVTAAEAS